MADPIKVIKDIAQAETDIGNYITSPGGNAFEQWYKDKFRDRCDEFANLPPWARALSGPAGGSLGRICQPHWDDTGKDGPVLDQPFTGGQCPSSYTVVFQRRQFSGGVWGWSNNINRSGTGPVGVESFAGPPNCSGQPGSVPTAYRLTFNGVPSGPTPLVNQCSDTSPGYRIISVTRAGGLPDNCGDPPPILIPGPNPPVNPGPQPGPEPRDNPTGSPIPEVPIPPYDDPVFGPQPFEPGAEPTGGGGNPSGGDGLPGSPDSVGDPAGSTGTDGEGEDFDFGEPPEGTVWVGVLIENTVDPRYGNIPGTGPENTVYPYVIGNASLRYSGGRGGSSRMRSRWHEIHRPVTALEVIGCFVQCRPGVSASVRPVSASICPDNPCEE